MVIQFAAAIKPYDVLFIEEPAVHGNIEVFKRIRESVNVPLATGENVRTVFGFIPYLQERCIDVLQPDCGQCGGISQMRKPVGPCGRDAASWRSSAGPRCVTPGARRC